MTAAHAEHIYQEYTQAVRNHQPVLAHSLYLKLVADDVVNEFQGSDYVGMGVCL